MAVLEHDDGLGVAEWRLIGLGERAIEREAELLICGLDERRPANLRQQHVLCIACR